MRNQKASGGCFILLMLIGCPVIAESLPDAVLQQAPKEFDVLMDEDHLAMTKSGGDERFVILGDTTEEETRGMRTLFIVKKDSINKTWRILAKSQTAIPDSSCGGAFGDCFSGVEFMKRGFAINLHGGGVQRWDKKFTFVYSGRDGTWELVDAEESAFQIRNNSLKLIEKITYRPPHDFGKIKIEDFDPYDYLGNGNR